MRLFIIILIFGPLLYASNVFADTVFFKDDFSTLNAWKPFNFSKVKKHTIYTIVPGSGKNILKTESDASASALVLNKTFNVYEYPEIRWRWKADNVYKKGDCGETRGGDDYAIRIYVLFKFEPDKAEFGERLEYNAAKLVYGDYPPKSSLNYVWANKDNGKKCYTSPFSDRSKIIIKSLPVDVGQWRTEEANIVKDYRDAFGEDPPAIASLSIMNDSDNTEEHSVSYIDFIEISK